MRAGLGSLHRCGGTWGSARAAFPSVLWLRPPLICFHVCVLLARRLDSLTRYLVDVKQQFEGHDHIGMVDEVLEALLHRQPKERVRPPESTIRSGEPLE